MKRFLLLFSAALFAASSITLLNVSSASAASSYDGLVSTVSPLILTDYNSGLSKTLSSDMEVLEQAFYAAEARCNQGIGPDPCTMRDDIQEIIDGDITDYVILGDNYYYGQSPTLGTFSSFRVFWSPSNQGEIYFSNEYAPALHVSAPDIRSTMSIIYDDGCPFYSTDECFVLSGSQIQSGVAWGHDQADIFTFFSSSFSIDYPTGYEGLPVPSNPLNPDVSFEMWLDITFSNALTTFNAKYLNYITDPEPLDVPQPGKIIWYLLDPDDIDVDNEGWQRVINFNSRVQDVRPDIVIPVLQGSGGLRGGYVCSAILDRDVEFTDNDCKINSLSPVPVNLDMREYLLVALPYQYDPEGFDVTPKNTILSINLSSSVSDYSTVTCTPGALDSNDGAYCSEYDPYEDCLAYGVNVVAGFQCVMSNFGIFMKNLFVLIFVPDGAVIATQFSRFTDTASSSLGFLWTPFQVIGDIFTEIRDSSATNHTCALPPLTIFGSTATIEFCAWRDDLPGLWSMMRIAIQGSIAVAFLFVCWRALMRFFGHDPGDDDDEGTTGREYVGKKPGGGMPL